MRCNAATTLAVLSLFVGWSAEARQFSVESPPLHLDVPGLEDSSLPQISDDFSESIVSVLSASTEHTIFLHLLQRSKCIPLLGHIGNATVFAPTDRAWKEWFDAHTPKSSSSELYLGWLGSSGIDEWLMEDEDVVFAVSSNSGNPEEALRRMDNQNWALRQHLLYHMLNYTLAPESLLARQSANITIETTLLFPLAQEPEHPPTPPPGPPWLPRGGDGMLGGHGQRLRFAKAGSDQGGDRGKVGLEHDGQGGVTIWNGEGWKHQTENQTFGKPNKIPGARWTRHGVVVGVEGVLEPPPSLDIVIANNPHLSYLSKLLSASTPLPSPLPENLATAEHLTIFAPSNKAFHGVFDDVERGYLEGGYGAEGVGRIFAGSVISSVDKKGIGWSDYLEKKGNQVESVSGLSLTVDAPSDGSLSVNGTEATAVDIFASNGVIHILPSLLLPPNFTLLNSAEKVLLSVNATRFVSLLRSANLSSTYIGEPGKDQEKEKAWTILAPTDDVLDMMDKWGSHGAPIPHEWAQAEAAIATVSSQMKRDEHFEDVSPIAALLQYHILPGRLSPSDIHDGMLVGTELRTSALKGGRQHLRIDVSENLNPEQWDGIGQGEIRFGGATALGQPVKSGKSIIYLISSLLSPPDDVLQTAVSDLQLSTFVAAVYASDLDKSLKKAPAVTYFMPRNRAFTTFGLGMKYLLLPEGKDELRKVIRYHVADHVVYSDDIEKGRTVYKTLEGGEVVMRRTKGKNATLSLSSPAKWPGHDSGVDLPSNGELRPAHIEHVDALTSTGVIHTIDSVMLPADVSLTISKLIRGSRQTTMADLMVRAGLGWILEGREPSSDEVSQAMLNGIVKTNDEVGDGSEPDIDSLAMPSYTLLVPSDQAFSRINITRYIRDKDALLDLLKLHIIPTQPKTPTFDSTKRPAEPPRDGQPLSLGDDLVYSTLLSSSSKYGDVAFRATGDNSYLVGIKGARSGQGNDVARVGASGRGSVRWRKSDREGLMRKGGSQNGTNVDDENLELWRGGLTLGGGVLVIDSVLIPFEPSWFNRWGWLIITLVGVGIVLLIAAGSFGWWWFTRNKSEEYEPLEGEEEE